MRLVVDDNWPALAAGQLRGQSRLCLPTGNTPFPFYGQLPVDALSATTVFLLDEFGLPVGDPARCDSMLPARLRRLSPHRGAQLRLR